MVASIQYIQRIVDTYARAAEANLKTPGRRNGLVVLDRELADEVMVTGDLHGHRENFNRIRRVADLGNHPRRHLVLQEVCHGGPTYPENGGCKSHAMLEDVARLKTQYPAQVHFLLGNHELSELTEYPIQKNKQMLNLMFRLGLQFTYGPATEKVREAYCPFLQSCPLAVSLPGGIFISHSLPKDVDAGGFDKSLLSRELESGDFWDRDGGVFDLVWGRDHRAENARAFADLVGATVLIHGHEPCPDGFCTPNDVQIILDCCGDNASYLIVPVGPALTQAQLVERIQRLG
ncbi:MAG: metallophosphoesterase [Pirellulales bacterium]|nr:metallophosphoesterase [Pirellulales bacterium]